MATFVLEHTFPGVGAGIDVKILSKNAAVSTTATTDSSGRISEEVESYPEYLLIVPSPNAKHSVWIVNTLGEKDVNWNGIPDGLEEIEEE